MTVRLIAKLIAPTLLLTAALAASTAHAGDYKAGAIVISNPWARATPSGATAGAGYFTVTNTGTTPDRLVAVTSEAARNADIHEMTMANGMMQMRPLKGGLELKPGETVQLEPGGEHVMMTGLKQPLKQGDHIKGTLTFEKAGKVDIEYDVQAVGAQAPTNAPARTPGNTMQIPGGGTMHMH
ncbi:MAG TPA: copper chaperone PCu(A)C [Xanthobacteraceae bacterium]|nr:copper chaperone PCu(A)C [Xanthobacteraceae bacterium]